MECDIVAFTSAFVCLAATIVVMTCSRLQYYDALEDNVRNLSERVEKAHAQYETDLLTLIRETLRPSQQPVDMTRPVDNNSIPGGPSGPI